MFSRLYFTDHNRLDFCSQLLCYVNFRTMWTLQSSRQQFHSSILQVVVAQVQLSRSGRCWTSEPEKNSSSLTASSHLIWIKERRIKCVANTHSHSLIFNLLSGVGSRGQQLQQGTPNFPFPGHINQLWLGDPEAFPGQCGDIISPPSPGSSRCSRGLPY